MASPTRPDLRVVEALCELALLARRLRGVIRLVDPSPELRELIVFAGLEQVLLDDVPEGGEAWREPRPCIPCPDP